MTFKVHSLWPALTHAENPGSESSPPGPHAETPAGTRGRCTAYLGGHLGCVLPTSGGRMHLLVVIVLQRKQEVGAG